MCVFYHAALNQHGVHTWLCLLWFRFGQSKGREKWVLHTKWIKHLNNVLIFSVTDLSE